MIRIVEPFRPIGVFEYDGIPDVVELYYLTPEAATTLLGDGRSSYLVIDARAIDGQWAGLNPARTVEAIRATFRLSPVARAGVWTLFRVGPIS